MMGWVIAIIVIYLLVVIAFSIDCGGSTYRTPTKQDEEEQEYWEENNR